MKKSTNQAGFTLMEIIVVLALMTILLIGLLSLYDWHAKIYSLEQGDIRATSSARTALNNMSLYLAQATSVMSFRAVNGVTYTSDADTMVIEMPTLGSTGNYIANTYDYVVYYIDNGKLYELDDFDASSVRPETTKQLAEGVQTFILTYNDDDPTLATTVEIDLQTSIPISATSSATAHVVDTILLRNHP
jgi:prepilin-type N-terminal cleavage/methylation domain-containing protein